MSSFTASDFCVNSLCFSLFSLALSPTLYFIFQPHSSIHLYIFFSHFLLSPPSLSSLFAAEGMRGVWINTSIVWESNYMAIPFITADYNPPSFHPCPTRQNHLLICGVMSTGYRPPPWLPTSLSFLSLLLSGVSSLFQKHTPQADENREHAHGFTHFAVR